MEEDENPIKTHNPPRNGSSVTSIHGTACIDSTSEIFIQETQNIDHTNLVFYSKLHRCLSSFIRSNTAFIFHLG